MKINNRRPNLTDTIGHAGQKFHITVGFDPENVGVHEGEFVGKPVEVFGYGPKVGTALWAMTQEACISTSYSLQRGRKPVNMQRDACRDDAGNPTSIIGVIYDLLADYAARWDDFVTGTQG